MPTKINHMHHHSHSPYDIAMPKDTYQKNVNTFWSGMDGVIVKVQRSEPLWYTERGFCINSTLFTRIFNFRGSHFNPLQAVDPRTFSFIVERADNEYIETQRSMVYLLQWAGVVRSTRSIETEDKFWMVLGIIRKTYVCSKLLCVCVFFFFEVFNCVVDRIMRDRQNYV